MAVKFTLCNANETSSRRITVSNNSIQCISCQKWVHQKGSDVKGGMCKLMKTFICRLCMIPVTSTGCTSVGIGVNANLELVDKFCYFGYMLSVDRDANAAVENRIRIGWNKFRQLVPLLTNKDISLKVREILYSSCVRRSVLYGRETWTVREENEVALQRAETRMVRWMCAVKLQDSSK